MQGVEEVWLFFVAAFEEFVRGINVKKTLTFLYHVWPMLISGYMGTLIVKAIEKRNNRKAIGLALALVPLFLIGLGIHYFVFVKSPPVAFILDFWWSEPGIEGVHFLQSFAWGVILGPFLFLISREKK